MILSYEYTPYIWLVLVSVALSTVLLIQAIRYRSAPGGVPTAFLLSFVILWMLAKGLSIAATDNIVRIFWFKFQAVLLVPIVTAALCFAVEYAGLGRFLNRRTLVLLAIVPLVFLILIMTNQIHHLVWTRIWFDGYIRSDNGVTFYFAMVYLYLLSLLHLSILIWLFVQSPRHRWIVAILIAAQLSTRIANFIGPIILSNNIYIDLLTIVLALALIPYSLAVLSFRMFDVVSIARNIIIERMADAMIVLDTKNRIVDLNGTAQGILSVTRSKVIDCNLKEVLPEFPDLKTLANHSEKIPYEICLENNRFYQVSLTPLVDDRGFKLGCLISLHEITELKRAQSQILANQRTLAMLNERELLARELHDGIGQLLAAANLHANSAMEFLARGDTTSVETCLKRLNDVTEEAKKSIRAYLLGIKSHPSTEEGLISVVRKFLDDYSHTYGINIELKASDMLENKLMDSAVETQLYSIIQEALTNARRHGKANSVSVIFALNDGHLQVTIEDNGSGFNPDEVTDKHGFGLRSMRGRAEDASGFFEVSSKPGQGTLISVRVPLRKEDL